MLITIYLIGLVAACQLYWFVTRRQRKTDRPPAGFAVFVTMFWPVTLSVFIFDAVLEKTFGEE